MSKRSGLEKKMIKRLKTKPCYLIAQRRYCERQYALGRKARKYWATDEEDAVVRPVLTRMLAEMRTERNKEKTDEANYNNEEETKRSACL